MQLAGLPTAIPSAGHLAPSGQCVIGGATHLAQTRVNVNPGDRIETDRVGVFNVWKGALEASLRKAGASAVQTRYSSDATADMNAGRANVYDLMVGPAPVIGSGIFVSGPGFDQGCLSVRRLETGAVFSDGRIPPGTPDVITGGVVA